MQLLDDGPTHGVDLRNRLDLVAEQLDPHGGVVVGREDLDHVAAHPELAPLEIELGPLVLDFDQFPEHGVPVDLRSRLEHEHHAVVRLRRSQAVDARHRGDDDDVAPFEQRARGRVAHAIDLVVDRGLFLDVGVALRDVSLRLVVVVVRHEVLDSVFGEEAAELLVELRRQGLVVRQDQSRPLDRLDDLRHREGLAAAGHSEEDLVFPRGAQAVHQLADGLGLIPLRLKFGRELEQSRHCGSPGRLSRGGLCARSR